MIQEEWLTTAQAAERLGGSTLGVIRWIERGVLKAEKLPGETGNWMVSRESLAAFERLMASTLTTREAASLVGTKTSRIWQAIRDGQIDARKVGGRWRVSAASLRDWEEPEPGRPGRPSPHPPSTVKRARWMYMKGKSLSQIATALGVDPATVSLWVRGKRRAKS